MHHLFSESLGEGSHKVLFLSFGTVETTVLESVILKGFESADFEPHVLCLRNPTIKATYTSLGLDKKWIHFWDQFGPEASHSEARKILSGLGSFGTKQGTVTRNVSQLRHSRSWDVLSRGSGFTKGGL